MQNQPPPEKPDKQPGPDIAGARPERIAKRIARAGLCSRREAEAWIAAGRVAVNSAVLASAALNVGPKDRIEVDGKPLSARERTRLWLYHKPRGLVTTARDPEGRKTVFSALPADLPRVISVGRLDINTQGLLLLTNDGGLARMMELPETGWLRRYRVRAHGQVTQQSLDRLKDGVAVDGVLYGAIEAVLDRQQGENVWLTVAIREGKNREIKNVLASLGLEVGRLIRISFGPFQLADLRESEVREIRGRTLRDQLGARLIAASGADFDAPILKPKANAGAAKKPGKPPIEGARGKHKAKPGMAKERALARLDTQPRAPNRRAGGKPRQRPDADRRR